MSSVMIPCLIYTTDVLSRWAWETPSDCTEEDPGEVAHPHIINLRCLSEYEWGKLEVEWEAW
jgi:hypothetical protein